MRLDRTLFLSGRRRGAFTTVEALIASGILAVSVISFYGSVSFGFGLLRSIREEVRATQILQERLELIRLYNWKQLNTSSFVPTSFTASLKPGNTNVFYHGEVSISGAPISESYTNYLRQVTVTISWEANKKTKKRTTNCIEGK